MKIQISGDVPKHLMEELQKDKPSSEASFWAKSSCKHCYGRGVIGKVTVKDSKNNVFVNDRLCICAQRAYKKWQNEWLDTRKKSGVEVDSQEKNFSSPQDRYDRIKVQFERLQEAKEAIYSELGCISDKIRLLPQQEVVLETSDKINDIVKQSDSIIEDQKDIKSDLEKLKEQRREIETKLKSKKHEIAVKEQELAESLKSYKRVQKELSFSYEAKLTAEKDLSRASHSLRKKYREAEKRLEKLQARQIKLLKKNDLEDEIDTESIQLADFTE